MRSDRPFPFACLWFELFSVAALLLATGGGCTGTIEGGASSVPPSSGSGGATGTPRGTDPGRVAIHRLNNLEYANTVRDLLGIDANVANFQAADCKGDSFDNIASECGVTDQQYDDYFNAAVDLSERTFADKAAAARVMSCTPASVSDVACFRSIITAWGLRAWRRPIRDDEIPSLTRLATDAMASGEDATGAVKQIVKAMLASPNFLYRIEMDPDPSSTDVHPLNGYELASRLSYLHWSTMPDQTLFDLAASGALLRDDTLTAQVDRMLADAKGQMFVKRFAGQWLGMDKVLTHMVLPLAFPMLTDALKKAMYQEGLAYFQDFLTGDGQMKDFFKAKVNFPNATLAMLYGLSGVTGDQTQRVENMVPNRQGFLGLAGFLTISSIEYRTAPTLRGKWVLENLLCQGVLMPPNDPNKPIPKLDDPANPDAMTMGQSENVAVRLAAHRTHPECMSCHGVLDPIGLGLENFDGIGQYRSSYANGDKIDASGIYDGKPFSGLPALINLITDPAAGHNKEAMDCVTKKLMIYSLSRLLNPMTDDPYQQQISQSWNGGSVKDLLKLIVLSQTFRFRRGDAM
ncbi:MAG TPA: DUF1592 domain-containing protein [Polyangia bacterium]|nr:DUF1592 domain-containing protein [Polyangia bacterium]